jgi:dTDP-4-dehydrorhamnose 3,5-epimerase
MSLKFIETSLPGVLLIEVDEFCDQRGFFKETYHQRKYLEGGIKKAFVQDNHSHSRRGTLRGLHYQLKHPQSKMVTVMSGEIFDIAVDIRLGSPTFGHWAGFHLSMSNRRQAFIPEGFAHGFYTLSDTADVTYKCSDFYVPGDDFGLLWSDPKIGIEWPDKNPLLSEKDSKNPELSEISEDNLPIYLPG